MKKAIQQLMLGRVIKNETQAISTLKEIKSWGYDGIELNSFMIHPTPFLVRLLTKLAGMPSGNAGKLDWHKIIEDSGMEVVSLHSDLGSLEKDPIAVAKEAKSFHTNYVVITGMYRFNYNDESELSKLCERLNKAGEVLKKEGISLLYHNHNVEWKRLDDGEFVYDYIVRHTNSDFLNFEFDSYWPSEAGANAIRIMESLGDRLKLHHINDRGNKDKGPFMTPILKSGACELGLGCMDLEALLDIDKKRQLDWVILETHNNFIDDSPLKSIEISSGFLKRFSEEP